MGAKIVGEFPPIERVPTGLWSLDRALGGGWAMTLYEVFGKKGVGKCLGKGTKVVMFDGTLREVENLKVGELLMGANSEPRKILSLAKGREQMYWIRQTNAMDYRVNESHILSLKLATTSSPYGDVEQGDIVNISVRDLLTQPKTFTAVHWKGYKNLIRFSNTQPLPVDPYFLGLWLGDGNSESVGITSGDSEVVDFIFSYANTLDLQVTEIGQRSGCSTYAITNKGQGNGSRFSLQGELRQLGVLNNKHIPDAYLYSSVDTRLRLLAGLIDSDGHKIHPCSYEITQKNKHLLFQIKFLCDSLGLRTSKQVREKMAQAQTGEPIKVYRFTFSGNLLTECPIQVHRKKTTTEQKLKINHSLTSIKIEKDIVDDYYGFTLDGDGLFLLEDMTVTHNTTFSTSMAGIVSRELGKDIVYAPVEHVDRDLMQSVLDSVSFGGSAYVLGGKDMMKEFMPEIKTGKDWHITDEQLGDCFVSALRRDDIGFGIFDSLTAVSPIEEMESSSADKNMGRRARLSGVWARQILQSSRFREGGLCPTTIWLTHESTQMGGYPSNTGTNTTGGEAKKNLSKIRIKLRKLPEPTMSDLEDNAWVIEGVTEHNNFFREKLKFYVVVLGGKGIHVGLSALYDCKMLKIASFGKSVTLGGEKFGNIRTLIEKAHNGEDEVFQPFIDALKNPSKFGKATDEEEYIEEPAE